MSVTTAAGLGPPTPRARLARPAVRLQAVPRLRLPAAGGRAAAGLPDLSARASASGSPSPTPRSAAAAVWVGLENFEYLLEDQLFWNAVFYSVFYTAVATVGKFGLGLWLALLLNQHLPFKTLLRAIILLPWIVPTVLSAIAFWWIYDPQFSIISYLFVDVLGWRDHQYRLPRHAPGRRAGR